MELITRDACSISIPPSVYIIYTRLEILQSQKEQQLRDLMILRDDCTEVVETCESTREKLYVVQKRGAQLLNR